MTPEWMTVSEICKHYDVTNAAVYKWADTFYTPDLVPARGTVTGPVRCRERACVLYRHEEFGEWLVRRREYERSYNSKLPEGSGKRVHLAASTREREVMHANTKVVREERLQTAINMRKNGETYNSIAEKIGVGPERVRTMLMRSERRAK